MDKYVYTTRLNLLNLKPEPFMNADLVVHTHRLPLLHEKNVKVSKDTQ